MEDFIGIFLCIIMAFLLFKFLPLLEKIGQLDKSRQTEKQPESRTITDMEYNLEYPLLRVWLPKGENKYGHVSLQTNEYYMSFWPEQQTDVQKEQDSSFWPDKDNKSKKGEKKADKSFKFKALVSGVPAAINFHPDFDCREEGDRFPDHKMPVKISECSNMDKLYEEFLCHNGISRELVNLKKGCYARKCNEMVERRDRVRAEKRLGKTKYTFLPYLKYKNEKPFYYDGQSCVSFVYHMIEWSKSVHSRKITIEFFGKFFKLLDLVTASFPIEHPKREVYVNVWMHTVDGRIVSGVERMLENQVTGELENLNSCIRRQTVATNPLTLSLEVPVHVEQIKNSVNLILGSIWTVPSFHQSSYSMNENNVREKVYQLA